jgi:lipopolysaccharide transport system permease protein
MPNKEIKANAALTNDEHWDMIIKPKSKLLDLQLKEVWRYRDLLVLFVKRDFTAQYKQTILGPLWHIIQPVLTTIMFVIVFDKIANIPTDNIFSVYFYMSGLTIWNYFASCINATSNTFVANASIFGKVYFPRMVIPLSVVASNMVKFVIQFLILIVTMIFFSFRGHAFVIYWTWLMIPFLVLIMAGMGLGLGIIISSLTTKYRDFTVLVAFGVQLLMYATPIVYPLSFIETKPFAWIAHYNPLTGITEAFKFALFQNHAFNQPALLYSIGFTAVVLFTGMLLFNKVEKSFMDTV